MDPFDLLREKQAEIVDLCRRHGVTRLRLFGSALSGNWDPGRSDLDFLVEFGSPVGQGKFEQVIGFYMSLEELLGRKVDIVDWNHTTNPFFRRHADRTAREVYAA